MWWIPWEREPTSYLLTPQSWPSELHSYSYRMSGNCTGHHGLLFRIGVHNLWQNSHGNFTGCSVLLSQPLQHTIHNLSIRWTDGTGKSGTGAVSTGLCQ